MGVATGGRARREIPLDAATLEHLAATVVDLAAGAPSPDEAARDEVYALLRQLVATGLTARQRRIVEMYFFEGWTQEAIADHLGIAQQVVGRQLFGSVRNGRRVGGAIARLRRLCEDHDLDPSRWV